MSKEREPWVFNKTITLGRNGSMRIVTQTTGESVVLKNPVKEKFIAPHLLDNLPALVMEAFPQEFKGTEGAEREEELIKKITRAYPTEQPMEAAERTLPTLMAAGIDIETIAEAIMTSNEAVRTALNLNSMSKASQNKKLEDLQKSMRKHWSSSGHRI